MVTPVAGEVIGLVRQLRDSVRQKGEVAVEIVRKSTRRLGEGMANLGSSRRLGTPRAADRERTGAGMEMTFPPLPNKAKKPKPPPPSPPSELSMASIDSGRFSTTI